MRRIALFWMAVLMGFGTSLSAAVTYCAPSAFGYGVSATGGSGTPVLVSSVSDLQKELNKGKNKVIIITANLTFTKMLSVQDGSNVTLLGLPGVTLTSNEQTASTSGSCLITAALLKGTRLGLIHHAEAGKRGFEGIVRQFVRGEGGDLTITSSCQSAGLSHDRNGSAAYYLIGKDFPIQDNTEGKVLGPFLMAAVEYERMNTY